MGSKKVRQEMWGSQKKKKIVCCDLIFFLAPPPRFLRVGVEKFLVKKRKKGVQAILKGLTQQQRLDLQSQIGTEIIQLGITDPKLGFFWE